MTIDGVGQGGVVQPRPRPPQESESREPLAAGPTPPAPPSIGVAALAPAGTDPELWALLTAEEREFFDRAHAVGPVTYGPKAAPADPSLPRGARIDVRV